MLWIYGPSPDNHSTRTLDRQNPRGEVESITRNGMDTQEQRRFDGPSWKSFGKTNYLENHDN